jgi:hypothetical protein
MFLLVLKIWNCSSGIPAWQGEFVMAILCNIV